MAKPATPSFLNSASPELRKVLTPLFQRIVALETQIASVGSVTKPLDSHLDANAQRLTNVAEATAGSDVPTLDQVKKYVQAAINQTLP